MQALNELPIVPRDPAKCFACGKNSKHESGTLSVPCDTCRVARFCSRACHDSAMQLLHRTLCNKTLPWLTRLINNDDGSVYQIMLGSNVADVVNKRHWIRATRNFKAGELIRIVVPTATVYSNTLDESKTRLYGFQTMCRQTHARERFVLYDDPDVFPAQFPCRSLRARLTYLMLTNGTLGDPVDEADAIFNSGLFETTALGSADDVPELAALTEFICHSPDSVDIKLQGRPALDIARAYGIVHQCAVEIKPPVPIYRDGDHTGAVIGLMFDPILALTNHDCRPNTAGYAIKNGAYYVFATRDINVGDELTRDYLDGLSQPFTLAKRRRALFETWHFTCVCRRCLEESGKQTPTDGADRGAEKSSDTSTTTTTTTTTTTITTITKTEAPLDTTAADKQARMELLTMASTDPHWCLTMFKDESYETFYRLAIGSIRAELRNYGFHEIGWHPTLRQAMSLGEPLEPFTDARKLYLDVLNTWSSIPACANDRHTMLLVHWLRFCLCVRPHVDHWVGCKLDDIKHGSQICKDGTWDMHVLYATSVLARPQMSDTQLRQHLLDLGTEGVELINITKQLRKLYYVDARKFDHSSNSVPMILSRTLSIMDTPQIDTECYSLTDTVLAVMQYVLPTAFNRYLVAFDMMLSILT